jgi:hypothetical protein
MKRLIITMLAQTTGLLFLTSQAAAEPIDGFELIAETEHLSFYSRPHRRLKIDARRCERFLQETAIRLGVAIDSRWSYYRHSHPVEVAYHAGPLASVSSGMTVPDAEEIHSVLAFHPHELVHVVAVQMGDPGRFFHEGLAVVLGDKARLQGQSVHSLAMRAGPSVNLLDLVRDFDGADPLTAYAIAGSFVDYLIKQYGLKKVADYFRICKPANMDRIAAFERTFGDTLPRIATRWSMAV